MDNDIGGHWICEVCKKPCTIGGFVEIFNANEKLGPVPSYPKEKSPDINPHDFDPVYDKIEKTGELPNAQELAQAQTKGALWLIDRPVNIDFKVSHSDCADTTDAGYPTYAIPCVEAATLERWIAWINHLQEKNWMGHFDTIRMLNFWWNHRELSAPHL